MKANELRIGNYVEPAEPEYKGQYFKVQSGDIKHIQDGSKLYKYKSIPLTPEILEKAGFTNEDKLHAGANTWWKEGMGEYLSFYYDGFLKYELTGRAVKYVHQLQNLYFALTGEELPIEL